MPDYPTAQEFTAAIRSPEEGFKRYTALLSQGVPEADARKVANVSLATIRKYSGVADEGVKALTEAARTETHDTWVEKLEKMGEEPYESLMALRAAQFHAENIKWLLSREDAKRYGDKAQADVVVQVDLVSAVEAARAKVIDLYGCADEVFRVERDVDDGEK